MTFFTYLTAPIKTGPCLGSLLTRTSLQKQKHSQSMKKMELATGARSVSLYDSGSGSGSGYSYGYGYGYRKPPVASSDQRTAACPLESGRVL